MSKNSDGKFYEGAQSDFSDYVLPLLESRKEEYRLIRLIKKGDREALAQFVKANLRMVISIAKKYARYGFFPLEDLIQEGNVGLMRAIKKFDPERGNKFYTHAKWWVRMSILEALEDKSKTIRTPSHRWQLFFRYKREKIETLVKGEKKNLNKKIARKLRIDEEELDRLREEMRNTISLQRKISSDDDSSELGDVIADPKITSPENRMDVSRVSEIVTTALEKLTKEEQKIYRLHFVEDIPLKEIAKIFSFTKEEIKRKKHILLQKLKKNPEILRCKSFLD